MRTKIEAHNNKHIAFFISSLRAGGGTRVLIDLANWLAEEGYRVDFLVLWPQGEYVSQISNKVNLISLARRRAFLSLFPMIKYLRGDPPQSLLATDELSHIIALMAKIVTGAPTRIVLRMGNVFSILWKTHTRLMDRTVVPFLANKLYPHADAIIAVSEGVANDLIRHLGLSRNKMHVIFSPKNIHELHEAASAPVQNSWLVDKKYPVIVTSSRLREQKDLQTLIRGFALLQPVLDSRLIIAGEGRERKNLEKLAHELGVEEKVSFTGYVENPHALVAKSDVFVTTSIWEGLSNALVEAVICGVPVIATDCDAGPREVLAPDTDQLFRRSEGIEYAKYGILIPMGGVAELKEALQVLLTSPELIERYTKAAQVRASAFDSDMILKEYLSVLLPVQ